MSIVMRAAKGAGEILIYEGIGADFWGEGMSAKRFAADIKALGDLDTLTVRINSGGGDVFDGIAIYEAIARNGAKKKRVAVDGLAASAASVIAMAGDEIEIASAGYIMIHNAHTFAVGEARDLRAAADLLDSVSGQIANIYSQRTGLGVAKLKAWMDAETWLDADQAIASGFATRKSSETVRAYACANLRNFKNVPAALSGRTAPVDTEALRRLASARAKVASSRG